mgnify:CR=1 FL=1
MQNNEITLGRIIRLFLIQSKLIILIVFLGGVLGILNYLNADKVYKSSSLIQLIQAQRSPNDNMDFILGTKSTTDTSVIRELYISRSNMLEIIKRTKANLVIDEDLNSDRSFIRIFSYVFSKGPAAPRNMTIDVTFDEFSYFVNASNIKEKEYKYDESYELDGVSFNFSKPNILGKKSIQLLNPEKFFNGFKSLFTIETKTKTQTPYGLMDSSLIEINFSSKNPNLAVDILQEANNLFIEESIIAEAETARKAIDFIEDRLIGVENDLNFEKVQLQNFREMNKSLDVDEEITQLLRTLQEIDSKISSTELELASASYEYTQTNPIFLSLQNNKLALEKQRDIIEEQIQALPKTQQDYIDLFRSLELKQKEYNDLIARKLELSIKEASTLGNLKVIDNAYLVGTISPRIRDIVATLIFSAFLALFIAFFRGRFLLPITNPAELRDEGVDLDIMGVVPYISGKEDSSEIDNNKLNQALENIIVGINKMGEANKITLFTSPTPTNGKSFLSAELSKRMGNIGIKTLLFDLDLKRGRQSKNTIDLEDFYKLDAERLEKYKASTSRYLLPRIKGSSQSFGIINSRKFDEKIEEFKLIFDHIIFDTAPILSVSDTLNLITKSDNNFLLIRHGLSKISDIRQTLNSIKQIGVNFDGIIYNAYERPSGYYGYYSVYGDYNYQYYANYLNDEYYDYK